jgi:hypothetical protein
MWALRQIHLREDEEKEENQKEENQKEENQKEENQKEEEQEEKVYNKRINIDYNMLRNILLFLFVTVFTIIIIYIPFLFGMVDDVKKNWNDYRCSPTVLPIAGYINKEENLSASEATQQNFEYCTGAISGSFMEEILQPFNYINNGLINLASDMNVNFSSFRQVFDNIRDSIMNIIMQVVGAVVHCIIGILTFVLSLSSTLRKMITMIVLAVYSLQTTTLALGSAWNGPTGNFIRSVAKVV